MTTAAQTLSQFKLDGGKLSASVEDYARDIASESDAELVIARLSDFAREGDSDAAFLADAVRDEVEALHRAATEANDYVEGYICGNF